MTLPELISNNIGHVLFIICMLSIALMLFSVYLILSAIGRMNGYHVKMLSVIYSPGFITLLFSALLITTHMVYK